MRNAHSLSPCPVVTHICDELAWSAGLVCLQSGLLRIGEICLRNLASRKGGVTPNHRHSACWPLLTTSQRHQPFHLQKIRPNSLFWNILPLTPTRSRFCREKFWPAQCLQDFRWVPGEGGNLWSAPECVQDVHFRKQGGTLLISKYWPPSQATATKVAFPAHPDTRRTFHRNLPRRTTYPQVADMYHLPPTLTPRTLF